MGYTPTDFSIGVIDLFGVLLPGSILALIFLDERELVFDELGIPEPTATGWQIAGILLAGYILGNLLRAAGEYVDILWYDNFYLPAFKRTSAAKPDRALRTNGKPATVRARFAAWRGRSKYVLGIGLDALRLLRPITQEQSDPLLAAAKAAAEDMAASESRRNVWSWADDYLRIASPAASSEVAQLSAQSKFFRSLALLLPFAIWQAWGESWRVVVLSALLICLALHQYARLRWKATNVLYQSFVMMRTVPELNKSNKPE